MQKTVGTQHLWQIAAWCSAILLVLVIWHRGPLKPIALYILLGLFAGSLLLRSVPGAYLVFIWISFLMLGPNYMPGTLDSVDGPPDLHVGLTSALTVTFLLSMFRWQTRVQLELGSAPGLNTTAQLVGGNRSPFPSTPWSKYSQVVMQNEILNGIIASIGSAAFGIIALQLTPYDQDLFDSLDIDTVAGGLIAALWLTIGLAMIGMTIATICWRIFLRPEDAAAHLQVLVHRELGNELAAISSAMERSEQRQRKRAGGASKSSAN